MIHNTSILLRNMVYEKLLEGMKEGTLAPGSLVSLKSLTENLGTSKTPLREALFQLQMEGFVTVLPQRGIEINPLKDEEKRQRFEVCAGLDYQVMLAVHPLLTAGHIDQMKLSNAQLLVSSDAQENKDCNAINTNFHNVYLDLCDNEYLTYLLRTNRKRLFLFSDRYWGEKFSKINYKEHKVLIELMENGSAKETAEYVRDVHWKYMW